GELYRLQPETHPLSLALQINILQITAVVGLRVVAAKVRASALLALQGTGNNHVGDGQQAVEIQPFLPFCVEAWRAADRDVLGGLMENGQRFLSAFKIAYIPH